MTCKEWSHIGIRKRKMVTTKGTMRKKQRKHRDNVREATCGTVQDCKSYRKPRDFSEQKVTGDLHKYFLVGRLLWVKKRWTAGETGVGHFLERLAVEGR